MKAKRFNSAASDQNSAAHRRFSRVGLGGPLAIGALILALTIASPAVAHADSALPAQASKAGCAAADKPTMNIRRFQKAVSCLHNLQRRKSGQRNLAWNRGLSKVAGKHARDMVRRHYFEHLSPSHRDPMDRIAAGSYKPTVGCWSGGENLFFSRGSSTPRQLINAWMNSATHRRNIVMERWHDFGLGVVKTSPYGEQGGMTVVALFGTRSTRPCR